MKRNKYGGAVLALAGVMGTAGVAGAQEPTEPAASGATDLGFSAGASTTGDTQAKEGETTAAEMQPTALPAPPAPMYPAATAPMPPPAPTTAPVPPPAPTTVPVPPPAPTPEPSDHEKVTGSFGVGLLGVTALDNMLPNGETFGSSLPLIGLRQWARKTWGWQLGVGASHHSGTRSDSTPGRENLDDRTVWNMGGHLGFPLAVYWDDHYTFLVLPDVDVAYSAWRQLDDANTPEDQGLSGSAWSLSGGARVGAEVHFGFIGVPMLTLQGTVGVDLVWHKARARSFEAGRKIFRGRWGLDLETANFNDPWALFTNSISALYYFQ